MKEKNLDYPYPEKGSRVAPDRLEAQILVRAQIHEGGSREMPAPAAKNQRLESPQRS